ncbi:MAG: hypothetical protein M1819_000020 [Sarea resinae]|nr:MAG: hypothetical protein M1819_000020 [Sarea resinae]
MPQFTPAIAAALQNPQIVQILQCIKEHVVPHVQAHPFATVFGALNLILTPNSKTLRRLASDHASLHNSPLPPHYLFPPTNDSSSLPDDLTQLTILLAGPQGTPYSQGLWKLHLKIPEDYPRSPPKAAFRTRIWHPNVEESTGSVCVDTLKRDWEAKLTLRDVLMTISCLLIQPNPDSALNSAAGQLLQDDYEAFARQAKLMTSIHAIIPKELKAAVTEAKRRGEEEGTAIPEEKEESSTSSGRTTSSSVVMKKKPHLAHPSMLRVNSALSSSSSSSSVQPRQTAQNAEDSSDSEEDEASASKENDPSLSPSPVNSLPPSPRKHILGKRPLSDLPTPVDPDEEYFGAIEKDEDGLTASERNIANNIAAEPQRDQRSVSTASSTNPRNKSPKLTERGKGINASGRLRQDIDDNEPLITPFCDADAEDEEDQDSNTVEPPAPIRPPLFPTKGGEPSDEGKENITNPSRSTSSKDRPTLLKKAVTPSSSSSASGLGVKSAVGRKVSSTSTSSSTSSKSAKPRVGLRRL